MKCSNSFHLTDPVAGVQLGAIGQLSWHFELILRPAAAQEEQLRSFEKYQVSLLEIFIQLVWVEIEYYNFKKTPYDAHMQPRLQNCNRII